MPSCAGLHSGSAAIAFDRGGPSSQRDLYCGSHPTFRTPSKASLSHCRSALRTTGKSNCRPSRLVPMGLNLTSNLKTFMEQRANAYSTKPEASLFLTRNGNPLARFTAENTFRRLCIRADVRRCDGSRYQPRLHDLRHAAAVHRLVSWYREGADVNRLLPQLATYLGHVPGQTHHELSRMSSCQRKASSQAACKRLPCAICIPEICVRNRCARMPLAASVHKSAKKEGSALCGTVDHSASFV